MTWGPIDQSWGEGWDDFDQDIDPFEPGGGGVAVAARSRAAAKAKATPKPKPKSTPRQQSKSKSKAKVTSRPAPRRPAPSLRAVRTEPRRPRTGSPRRRSRLVGVALVVLLLAVVGKLVQLQVVGPDRYVEAGEAQRLRTVPIDADRGRILDRAGNDLALSVLRPTVFADPSQITDPEATAAELAPLLRVGTAELVEKLSADNRFEYLARRVDDKLAARVVELDLDGVHLVEEPARFTPSDDLARSVIGQVATDQTGATGIELIYDDALTGTPGEVRYERARDGGTIAAGGTSRTPAQAGSDIVLTIDRSLQYEAERVLSAQVGELGAKGGMALISDPNTGEILAMANITRAEEGGAVQPAGANLALTSVFEPGSVNKVITIAASLEEGLVEPHTEFVVPWRHQVSDHLFSDDHSHATAPMTVTSILADSSNVGTIMIGQQLGKHRIDEYLRSFGFGSKTALDFPNESAGLLLPTDRWSGTSIGSIPIGQGIAVTAMQMLSAYNVIANDGVYVAPRLVQGVVDADGTRVDEPVTPGHRVVSDETAAQVRAMLTQAVLDGTGKKAQVEGYTVAGKTGTARKPQATGTYQDEAGNYHYVAAFTGMVPAEDPALSIIVVIDEPTANIYGGSAAAPVFADLARFALNRFRIPPGGAAGA